MLESETTSPRLTSLPMPLAECRTLGDQDALPPPEDPCPPELTQGSEAFEGTFNSHVYTQVLLTLSRLFLTVLRSPSPSPTSSRSLGLEGMSPLPTDLADSNGGDMSRNEFIIASFHVVRCGMLHHELCDLVAHR